MPFTSKWPYRKVLGRNVEVKYLNFDGDRTVVTKGPDYQLIDNQSSSEESTTEDTMSEESKESIVPKKKNGFFASIFGLFKRKKTPLRSETLISIVSKEDGGNTSSGNEPNVSQDAEKTNEEGFANPAFIVEKTMGNILQTSLVQETAEKCSYDQNVIQVESRICFQEQWRRMEEQISKTTDV